MKKTDLPYKPFKIMLVDDHDLFREGLRLLIEVEKLGQVIAESDNGKAFLDLLDKHTPDLVILDVDMPIMNGLEAAQKAIEKFPEIKILIVSMHGTHEYYYSFIEIGVKGFILKSAGKTELELAIRKISNGESYFSQQLLVSLVNDIKKQKHLQKNDAIITLTEREKETLNLLCAGLSLREIADKVSLSIKTVEAYRTSLMQKTGTKNTLSLVLYAIKNKLVTEF